MRAACLCGRVALAVLVPGSLLAQQPSGEANVTAGPAVTASSEGGTAQPSAAPTVDTREPSPPPPMAMRAPRSLGPSFDMDVMRHLPLANGLWSVFETVESTAILDRMDNGGLYVGETGLVGVRGSSWTQASWMLGDFDITDPDRTGTPLFFVAPEMLDRVDIASGVSPADWRGFGPGIGLSLKRPGVSWSRSVLVQHVPSFLQQSPQRDGAPAIAHLASFNSARVHVDGPVIADRLGVAVSGTLARAERRERGDRFAVPGHETGLLAHAVYAASAQDEVRVAAGFQALAHSYGGRARYGAADSRQSDRFALVHGTWERRTARPWSVTAGVVRASFSPDLEGPATGVVDRLTDGPVQLQFPGRSARSRWSASGWYAPFTTARHAVRVGGSLSRTASTTRPAEALALTAETVGGHPARVWEYGWRGPSSRWRGIELEAHASDQFRYGPLLLDAGLRFEAAHASAAGSAGRVQWVGVSPRLLARVQPSRRDPFTLLAGWAQYRSRLPLSLLAFGDPAGPQGVFHRWRDANGNRVFDAGERGPLVARVGPGGDSASIDPDLQSPRSREVFVGIETGGAAWRFRFLAYYRWDRGFLGSVNVGAPLTAYDVYFVHDPSNDIVGAADDQLLPVFDRRPDSFGQDSYLLTNDAVHGNGKGLEISVDGRVGRRLHILAGATASKSIGPPGYRGFQATENDSGVVGERLELPNATTLSRGRLFFERGYTIKLAGVYQAPHDLHLGVTTRYQDGQHFARFVIPTDLNQGPEPINGITNGESRFTYVLTIDARLEKGFTLRGGNRVAAIVEAFNLRGTGIEIEEDVIWGPAYRSTTAVQPPRAVRFGLRFDF